VSGCVTNLGVWNINPRLNTLLTTTSGTVGDSATWTLKDGSRQEFYSAFATNSGNIIVEKYRFNTDSDLEIVSTIQFKAENGWGRCRYLSPLTQGPQYNRFWEDLPRALFKLCDEVFRSSTH